MDFGDANKFVNLLERMRRAIAQMVPTSELLSEMQASFAAERLAWPEGSLGPEGRGGVDLDICQVAQCLSPEKQPSYEMKCFEFTYFDRENGTQHSFVGDPSTIKCGQTGGQAMEMAYDVNSDVDDVMFYMSTVCSQLANSAD